MKRFRIIWFGTAGVMLLWLAYLGGGNIVAQKLGVRFGHLVLKATRGNVGDPAVFIQYRLSEGLLLATLLTVAVWLHVAITGMVLRKSTGKNRRWIAHAVSAFLLFNLWLGFATQTTLFWCALWQGDVTQNLTRFHLKRLLFVENQSPAKAVILGNSQSRSQLDEELLNEILEPGWHAAELHFPGSNAYDILLEHRKIKSANPNLVIVYLSELTFYNGNHHDAAANFFEFSDLKDLASSDVRNCVPRQGFQYGLLGAALPVFRLRDVFSQRLLGTGLTLLKQRQYDQQRAENLETTGRKVAQDYRIDAKSEFEMRAFTEFVSDCAAAGEKLLLLAGQLNPLLSQGFDPKIRPHFLAYLHQLRDRYPNVILVENLPFQSPSDYEDLTHVKKEIQRDFTRRIAEFLQPPTEIK